MILVRIQLTAEEKAELRVLRNESVYLVDDTLTSGIRVLGTPSS